MNIVNQGGEVRLTIVNGGACSPSDRVEGPTVSTVEARVRALIEESRADIEPWEAVAHVAAFERDLGRECDDDEIVDVVSHVMMARLEFERLSRVLAGDGTLFVMFDDTVFVGRDEPERLAKWREHYKEERRARKSRSA